MRVSLEKELEVQLKKKKESMNVDPILNVNRLLENETIEDNRILRALSNNSQFNRLEHIKSEKIELERIENTYDGKVYTIDEIKKLAIDYHLRFLPSSKYTGSFDVQIISKIKDFGNKTNTPIDDYSLQRRCYILAPEECFSLENVKIEKKQKDPLLFYKIDNNHYKLIHKWGSDFTIFRYLSGFRWKGYWSHLLFNTIMCLPIFMFLVGMVSSVEFMVEYPINVFILSFMTSGIFSYFRWSWSKADDGDIIHEYFSPTKWDTDKKIIK